ncbi:hypothetical protein OG613_48270 (plasmid) [Streptomyces sp. NBC_00015]|uniref:hypothetical protein n=1 Tax=Streptomyces sp. NBC_00015 TaxID=2903611 RepID=UPI002F90F86A
MKEVEEEPSSDFPRGRDWWERLHTENFDTLAKVVAMVRDELLPSWWEQLADSPMVEFADLYVSSAASACGAASRGLARCSSARAHSRGDCQGGGAVDDIG